MRSFVKRIAVVSVAAVVAGLGMSLGGRVQGASVSDDMHGHMTMTPLRPAEPGDKERAETIAVAARKFAENYRDYHKALADGYQIFHPEIKQPVYHFTNEAQAVDTTIHFDPARPTSLLYERTASATKGGEPGYKLVGVMYTAPFRYTEAQLDRRVPLSITHWHLHTNLCLPPAGTREDALAPGGKFGLEGSITTEEACKAAGGSFIPHLFGWMVHVYPFETDPAKVWASGEEDEHNMNHDAGMKMPM